MGNSSDKTSSDKQLTRTFEVRFKDSPKKSPNIIYVEKNKPLEVDFSAREDTFFSSFRFKYTNLDLLYDSGSEFIIKKNNDDYSSVTIIFVLKSKFNNNK